MGKNILIVDDNDNNLFVLENILEDLPFSVTKATSGKEALKIILKEHVDMVLLDVKMPVMDGYQVAELIRNRPKTKDMPIIFLTGAVNEEYTQFKEKYPDNVACVLKPIDIEAIKTHINHLMQ